MENTKNTKNTILAKLRSMDIDDLYILTELLNDVTPAIICKSLLVTPPAISHRMRKLDKLFGPGLYVKTGSSLKLSARGQALAHKSRAGLEVCLSMIQTPES